MRNRHRVGIAEGTHIHNGVSVKYKFRKAIGDRRNLIVIFSGFRKRGTYDFDGGPASGVRGNILWIQDDFDDSFTYYLCRNLDFAVEAAVISLIDEFARSLGISRDQCIAAGFSKGGSAALYYGIKYDLGAIVATVPQLHIGSYVKKYWPDVFLAMTLEASERECAYLDLLLPEVIAADRNPSRNIYLFSSESDPQHTTEIVPYLDEFKKYNNFNYVLTASPLVTSHIAVTRYNVPLLVSVLSMLSENLKPVLGSVMNGSLSPGNAASGGSIELVREREEPIHAFTSVKLRGSTFLPDGYAFIKGYAAKAYGTVRTTLKFSSRSFTHEIPLGGVIDPMLSTQFYENQFCDYSVGKFASLANRGISLRELPFGRYDVSLDIHHEGKRSLVPARMERAMEIWSTGEGSLYKFEADGASAQLTKRPALGIKGSGVYFSEVRRWSTGSKVHFEGYFAVQGIPVARYSDVSYYLVLSDLNGGGVEAFSMASANRPQVNTHFGEAWMDYSKAYFATPKYAGIEIPGVSPGQYSAAITARFGDTVFSEQLEGTLSVSSSFSTLGSVGTKPVVDIIGSCVSRDNFNSRLSPDWKSYFVLGNEYYQSAFLSLMAAPVQGSWGGLDTGDTHSTRVTVRDFTKEYLSEVRADGGPDMLVIDLFADARFGCVRVGGSLVTNNEWKLHETSYWKGLDKAQTLNMRNNESEYLEEFRIAANRFNSLRQQYFPKTRIVLNSARAVYSYFDKGSRVQFPKKSVSDLNARWSKLDEVFLECVPAEVVSAATPTTLSDPAHPWGPAPYHYEAEYYSRFREQLFNLLGYEMSVSLD